jgi:hypothetical protein
MDKVQKYASTNANTPSLETYRSDLWACMLPRHGNQASGGTFHPICFSSSCDVK